MSTVVRPRKHTAMESGAETTRRHTDHFLPVTDAAIISCYPSRTTGRLAAMPHWERIDVYSSKAPDMGHPLLSLS